MDYEYFFGVSANAWSDSDLDQNFDLNDRRLLNCYLAVHIREHNSPGDSAGVRVEVQGCAYINMEEPIFTFPPSLRLERKSHNLANQKKVPFDPLRVRRTCERSVSHVMPS